MALATASADGSPSVRMVLLKEADERGFVFFTNYGSRKARELAENPQAALLFHLPDARPKTGQPAAAPGRQIRVEGDVTRLSDGESDAYWAVRPPGSRIGAVASRQSEVLSSREELERRVAAVDPDPPRPDFWGGFRLIPHTVEFWEHRDDRLHDRVRHRREGDGWVSELLYP